MHWRCRAAQHFLDPDNISATEEAYRIHTSQLLTTLAYSLRQSVNSIPIPSSADNMHLRCSPNLLGLWSNMTRVTLDDVYIPTWQDDTFEAYVLEMS